MSEELLEALMQLFAVAADVDGLTDRSRQVVEETLQSELDEESVANYLAIYDGYIAEHHTQSKDAKKKKKTSRNSVKMLRICAEMNKNLLLGQKVVLLLRLVEYMHTQERISDLNVEFVDTVAEGLHIPQKELNELRLFVEIDQYSPELPHCFLFFTSDTSIVNNKNVLLREGLKFPLVVYHHPASRMYLFRSTGKNGIMLSGQVVKPHRGYALFHGASIRGSTITPIFMADIINAFGSADAKDEVLLKVKQVSYNFSAEKVGLNDISFQAKSGELVGIMGGSGTGKSTLINVLNGTTKPSKGSVEVNGHDLHKNIDKMRGIMGYVPQDDLVIEELTVWENLYYTAKLCFGDATEEEVKARVKETLRSLGLYEIRRNTVGNPLKRTISGGQRKRLNIALELVRKPKVLFVDEPTSGLSSRDSEILMDLLKDLTLKGHLIFTVIHQPSSEIFQMLDNLLILDVGGVLIYRGHPVDALPYFKRAVGMVHNGRLDGKDVNPEMVFNIIETRVVDEFGRETEVRRLKPDFWKKRFDTALRSKHKDANVVPHLPKNVFKPAKKPLQWWYMLKRDVLSKLANRQYLLINLLEAPLLALLVSFFIRYFDTSAESSGQYVLYENVNLPAYIFIAVLVSVFLGLSVSAEEIVRDRVVRKREAFLNLSNGAYLLSKASVLFGVSAIQASLFVLVGNAVMEIHGMFWYYFFMLFSLSCLANIIGLNISASFKSAVTIYILIPFLIIPQILFSGLLVKYHQLHPIIGSEKDVPAVGQAMPSRWAMEGLMTYQFTSNDYESALFGVHQALYESAYKKNYWIPYLEGKVNTLLQGDSSKEDLALLVHELDKEFFKPEESDTLTNRFLKGDILGMQQLQGVRAYLGSLDEKYKTIHKKKLYERDEMLLKLSEAHGGMKGLVAWRNTMVNKELEDLVTNRNDIKRLVEVDGELVRRDKVVYVIGDGISSPFLVAYKKAFGEVLPTYWYNIAILWLTTIIAFILLYFDVLPRIINAEVFQRRPK